MVDVTYTARPGDPVHTVWDGLHFEHGKPTAVPAGHRLLKQPVGVDGQPLKDADGKPMPSPVEASDWFSVGDKKPEPKNKAKEPDSVSAYFAYASAWIAAATQSGALKSRWDNELPMRERLGWSGEDSDRMEPIMKPKFEALKKAERELQ